MENQNITIALLGLTGSGKSALGNTMTGKANFFVESSNPESQTQDVVGTDGLFDNKPIFIIDTPGLYDSNNNDNEHLNQMTNYFRNKPELKSFFILINYNNIRIDGAIINFFQILQNMYPNKKFYNHMSIIWTFFDGVEDKTKMEQKKNGLKICLKRIFRELLMRN